MASSEIQLILKTYPDQTLPSLTSKIPIFQNYFSRFKTTTAKLGYNELLLITNTKMSFVGLGELPKQFSRL